jgi:hypothetical protein
MTTAVFRRLFFDYAVVWCMGIEPTPEIPAKVTL